MENERWYLVDELNGSSYFMRLTDEAIERMKRIGLNRLIRPIYFGEPIYLNDSSNPLQSQPAPPSGHCGRPWGIGGRRAAMGKIATLSNLQARLAPAS